MNHMNNTHSLSPLTLDTGSNNYHHSSIHAGHAQDPEWVRKNLNGLYYANIVLEKIQGDTSLSIPNVIVSSVEEPFSSYFQRTFPTNRRHDQLCSELWSCLERLQIKTNEYYNRLREHEQSHECRFLKEWLDHNPDSSMMRWFGLSALEGISGGRSSNDNDLFSAMVVQCCIYETDTYRSPDVAHSAMHHEAWNRLFTAEARQSLDCVRQMFFTPNASHSNPQTGGMSSGIFDPLHGLGNQHLDNGSQPQLPVDEDDILQSLPLHHGQHYSQGSSNYLSLGFDSNSPLTPLQGNISEPFIFPPRDQYSQIGLPDTSGLHFDQPPQLPASYGQQPQSASFDQLRRSRPFKALNIALHKYGSGDSGFLSAFSASHVAGETSYPLTASETGSEMRKEQLRVCIRPLLDHLQRSDSSNKVVHSIVMATNHALCQGTLNCLRLVESYLLHLGKNLLPQESYRPFHCVVLDKCQEISSKPKSKRFLYGGLPVHEEKYSQHYFQSRKSNIPSELCGKWSPKDVISKHRFASPMPNSSGFLAPPTAPTASDATSDISDPLSPSIPQDMISSPGTSVSGQHHKQCNICGKEYYGNSAVTSLSRHKRKHKDLQTSGYTCLYCPETATRSDNLRTHIKNNHPGLSIPCGKQQWARASSRSRASS